MAKLPDDIQEIIKRKQEYIDSNRSRLEANVIKLQEALLNRFIEEILPQLETENGSIKSTTNNMRLIEKLDALYQEFNATNQTKVIKELGESLLRLNSLNSTYFKKITESEKLKTRFDSVISKTNDLMSARLGVGKDGKIIKGSYLDSFITDNTLLTELKQSIVSNVTGQQTIEKFRKDIRDKIVGNSQQTGGFEKYYRQFAYDTYSQYDRAYGKNVADEFGLNYAIYQGGLIDDSRDFCEEHQGKVYTREEVKEFGKWKLPKDTKEYPGPGEVPSYIAKFPNYDPFTCAGGFNCRHQLTWVTKSYAERLRPDLKEKELEPIKKPAKEKTEKLIEEKKVEQIDYQKELDTLRKQYQRALDDGDVAAMTEIGVKLSKISVLIQKEQSKPITKESKTKIDKPKGLTVDQARKETVESKAFSDNEKEAVNTYTKGNYTQINAYLRGQMKQISQTNSDVVKGLDSFIKKAPKVEAETYRGLGFSEKQDFEKFINLKNGDPYTDDGFMSTTYDRNVARTFTNLEAFKVTLTIKGKNGVYIEHLSDAKKEKEILFGRGSKFKVISIKKSVKDQYGNAEIEIQEL